MFLRNSSQVADSIVAASPNSLKSKKENITVVNTRGYSVGGQIIYTT